MGALPSTGTRKPRRRLCCMRTQLVDHMKTRLLPAASNRRRSQRSSNSKPNSSRRTQAGFQRCVAGRDRDSDLAAEFGRLRRMPGAPVKACSSADCKVLRLIGLYAQSLSFSPLFTFSCRVTMPWINASGRGGQPATYTSTGTTSSTPCTMA